MGVCLMFFYIPCFGPLPPLLLLLRVMMGLGFLPPPPVALCYVWVLDVLDRNVRARANTINKLIRISTVCVFVVLFVFVKIQNVLIVSINKNTTTRINRKYFSFFLSLFLSQTQLKEDKQRNKKTLKSTNNNIFIFTHRKTSSC